MPDGVTTSVSAKAAPFNARTPASVRAIRFITTPSILSDDLADGLRGLHGVDAPLIGSNAEDLLQRQADARHRIVLGADVLAGLETAAGGTGDDDRQVFHGVELGVTHVGESIHRHTVEQCAITFL